jgi:IstB-like ATP binding protein
MFHPAAPRRDVPSLRATVGPLPPPTVQTAGDTDNGCKLRAPDTRHYDAGPTGTGKSGIAIGILREACLNGYRGRFYDAQDLLDELYASLADRSTARLLKRLSRLQPLLIDKVDNLNVKPEQANAFFRLIDQRYNRVSTIITTALALDDWYELFGKKHLVDALLDRLRHRCITITIDGPSLRSPEPQAAVLPEQKRSSRLTRQQSRRGAAARERAGANA